MKARGFTLIELMVVITIVAILSALAAPSFKSAILSNKLTGFVNTFIASANMARSEAIKRNVTIRMCRSSDGATCAGSGNWQQGWIIFNDIDNDGVVDANETILHSQQALSADYLFTGDSYSIAFLPTGGVAAVATLNLCRASPDPGTQERILKFSATGRPSVETTKNGVCA